MLYRDEGQIQDLESIPGLFAPSTAVSQHIMMTRGKCEKDKSRGL